MKTSYLLCALLLTTMMVPAAQAAIEPDYISEFPPVSTPWFDYVTRDSKQADLDFITGMHPHHAGALTMSKQYLENDKSLNKGLMALAGGIIHNQKFEIYMLETVENRMKAFNPPEGGKQYGQIASKGLAQANKYRKLPMPAFKDKGNVSAEDVRFAKAMKIHHEGALIMARDYLANPHVDNGYLRGMCFDIIRDQTMEIAYMDDIVSAYKGDASAIKIDPSMVHGMEGMKHGGRQVHMNMSHTHH